MTRQAEWLARRRAEWAAAGLCLDCGGSVAVEARTGRPGRPATGYRCRKCRARRAAQAARRRAGADDFRI